MKLIKISYESKGIKEEASIKTNSDNTMKTAKLILTEILKQDENANLKCIFICDAE